MPSFSTWNAASSLPTCGTRTSTASSWPSTPAPPRYRRQQGCLQGNLTLEWRNLQCVPEKWHLLYYLPNLIRQPYDQFRTLQSSLTREAREAITTRTSPRCDRSSVIASACSIDCTVEWVTQDIKIGLHICGAAVEKVSTVQEERKKKMRRSVHSSRLVIVLFPGIV